MEGVKEVQGCGGHVGGAMIDLSHFSNVLLICEGRDNAIGWI